MFENKEIILENTYTFAYYSYFYREGILYCEYSNYIWSRIMKLTLPKKNFFWWTVILATVAVGAYAIAFFVVLPHLLHFRYCVSSSSVHFIGIICSFRLLLRDARTMKGSGGND